MIDRFALMRTLVAAVDGGSISAASRSLRMPLATVSRRVSDLEAHLKTQLLVRGSRRLTLTDAGADYVTACRRILDALDDAERAATGEYHAPRGHLTLTAPVMFGRLHVEPVLLDFLKAYPDITARLVLTDSSINLIDDHIDAAVRIGALADSGMIAARLGTVRWITCASPDYLRSHGTPAVPADLTAHEIIAFEGNYANSVWRFGSARAAVAIPLKPRFAVNTSAAALDAATAGTGIARLLSYQVAAPVERGALQLILRAFEPDPLPVHLLYHRHAMIPLKLRAWLDFTGPRLKLRLSGAPE